MAYGTGFGGAFGASRRPPVAATQPLQYAPPSPLPAAAAPAPGPQPVPQGRALPRPTRRPVPQPPRNMQPGRGLQRPIRQPMAMPNNMPMVDNPGMGSQEEQLLYNDMRGSGATVNDFMGNQGEFGPMPGQFGQVQGAPSSVFQRPPMQPNMPPPGGNEFQVQGGPSSQFRGPQAGLQGAPSRNFNEQFPQGRGGDDMVSTMPVRPRRPAPKVPPRRNMPGVVGAPPRRSGSVY